VRAVQFAEYGGPEVLGVAEVAERHAGPGQIRIAVRAASVNAIDWKKRSGMLAFDCAGFGALPALIEITGSPDNVVTIADGSGDELGVRVSGGDITRALHGLTEAARLWEAGRFSLPVERTFSFAEAAEAHRLSAAGHVRGKLAIVPL
jgi:NADPH:quinone reductase-like Zn-dependent oxidoreductase